ncbi:MAG TPA: SWIM zinc finger family protein [Jiangellaceae bacterium]|nr:SWIM zinc finger family protein [Jiangellaceae bacterium]
MNDPMNDTARQPVRGFPAFPRVKPRTPFGRTRWGRAWLEALTTSSLDSDALARGRTLARSGAVGSITVSPGRLGAAVLAADDDVAHASVVVERFSTERWATLLAELARSTGHLAALVDGALPPELIAASHDAGTPLLPGIGELEPSCTCDDWGFPCPHAAALCYQAGWLLDTDPMLVFLLRGRGADDVVVELERHARAEPSPACDDTPAGLTADTLDELIALAAQRATTLLETSRQGTDRQNVSG